MVHSSAVKFNLTGTFMSVMCLQGTACEGGLTNGVSNHHIKKTPKIHRSQSVLAGAMDGRFLN